jgi:hypothetical protein
VRRILAEGAHDVLGVVDRVLEVRVARVQRDPGPGAVWVSWFPAGDLDVTGDYLIVEGRPREGYVREDSGAPRKLDHDPLDAQPPHALRVVHLWPGSANYPVVLICLSAMLICTAGPILRICASVQIGLSEALQRTIAIWSVFDVRFCKVLHADYC